MSNDAKGGVKSSQVPCHGALGATETANNNYCCFYYYQYIIVMYYCCYCYYSVWPALVFLT